MNFMADWNVVMFLCSPALKVKPFKNNVIDHLQETLFL